MTREALEEVAHRSADESDPQATMNNVLTMLQPRPHVIDSLTDIAVEQADGKTLTYAELHQQSNLLAANLTHEGVRAGDLVGILMERNVLRVVAILGVLKSGAAYVPIEPSLPAARIGKMIEDAGCAALLLEERLLALGPRDFAGYVVTMDSDWDIVAGSPSTSSPAPPHPLDPAYVIFTSGSTGEPKAVAIAHASLARLTEALASELQLTASDRVLQFASFAWDTMIEELFPALHAGACLVLRSSEMSESIPTFLDECDRLGITVLDLPTAFWHELVDHLSRHQQAALPSSIRWVTIGGEAALPQRVAQWWELVSDSVVLMNSYGCTETTAITTIVRLSRGLASGAHSVPIGRPLAGVRTWIVNEDLVPVQPGQPGELLVGGTGVGLGYLHDPDLTARRFIPFKGERVYRTGDLVMAGGDGHMSFIGRRDHQVKVRGVRVELGEVEAALVRCEPVAAAAVVAIEFGDHHQLVAFTRPFEGARCTSEELREALARELPAQAVPVRVILVKKLPSTPTGKIDRQALRDLAQEGFRRDAGHVEHRTLTEDGVAWICETEVGLGAVQLDSGFVDQGGDSLGVLRLIAGINERWGVVIGADVILSGVSLRDVAKLIDMHRGPGAGV